MQNQKEFIEIIQQNQGLIYKVAKVYTNSKEDEQDLYQEIVYQVWKSFGSFKRGSKISTWMYRIALNTAIVHLNREKRKGSQVPIDEELLNMTDTAGSLEDERSVALFNHIKTLNEVEKGIILLYLDGNSYEDIANITGFTPTNIGTRLGRIKLKLKSKIT
ncbi:RNA polymerase sigma factor [Mucilaginibacter paludis]|uniref:RNA polymerase, sigma-24 subunit, ECF subfamily n=1 Tax=Mucilaginibacter paludis DSM 18603 TaxID=714943 RepID=H1YIZ7_9SPHI|nr:sigma-70 family RNA polymerase sigma factor [Mucilaginibacter paludis]EHQ27692.1 RNA polymerase, sigma-24 subunit, ECF subfamily [Mucilaginibacter paludis DSM 18603]